MKKSVWAVVVILILSLGISSFWWKRNSPVSPPKTGKTLAEHKPVYQLGQKVQVMAIGGSAAHGWVDAKGMGGYLARTFRTLNQQTNKTFAFTNESIEGLGPTGFVKKMDGLLKKDKPNLVVISFGLLDDLYKKTPQSKIDAAVTEEIKDALNTHAVVVIVTPPITGASYVEFGSKETDAVQAELATVKQMDNPNVHTVDLFTQMKAYLADHHQTWKQYAADGWHPNAAGHALAASLLAADLEKSAWLTD
ncbi:SGNH/GDSL hydrolase family protein [Alicyclobacillus fodiniaquatilis]|uniref:SGNH/GDSL hydrolase family protein n=1 Tax=Alicyclobacillus fodiniaquatilis TaxID=1661150 RepID=A0ABW4JKZ1_9BACL